MLICLATLFASIDGNWNSNGAITQEEEFGTSATELEYPLNYPGHSTGNASDFTLWNLKEDLNSKIQRRKRKQVSGF